MYLISQKKKDFSGAESCKWSNLGLPPLLVNNQTLITFSSQKSIFKTFNPVKVLFFNREATMHNKSIRMTVKTHNMLSHLSSNRKERMIRSKTKQDIMEEAVERLYQEEIEKQLENK